MKVHKRAAAGVCPDKKNGRKKHSFMCFHLKMLVQEDIKGAPVNPFPPPASSAHPRLLEWFHSGVINVPVCSMASLLTQLLPCSLWNSGDFGRSSMPQCSHQPPRHAWGASANPKKAEFAPRKRLQKAAGASSCLQCLLSCKTQQGRANAGDNEHNSLIPAREAAGHGCN